MNQERAMNKFVGKFMLYLYDNYLPTPEGINWGEEFAVRHDFEEESGRPCNFCLYLSTYGSDKLVDEAMRKLYKDMGLKDKYEDVENRDWIFGLMHELGHVATLSQMDQASLSSSKFLISCLNFSESANENPNPEAYMRTCIAYWNTPVEKAANQWAVDIMNIFPNLVRDIEALIYSCFEEE